MTTRILFICKRRISYGVSYGLLNSARLVSHALNDLPNVVSKVVEAQDNNAIDKEVTDFKPTHVIIEALWVVPSKFPTLVKLHPSVQWIVRVHSKPSFIANEGIAMEWLAACAVQDPNVVIAANDEEFSITLSNLFGKKVLYLPNIYHPVYRPSHPSHHYEYFHVGCFGAIRPMKNHLTQAMASIEYAKKHDRFLAFHINGDRLEQKGEEVRKNLRALFDATPRTILVEHPWKSHEDFLGLVGAMDMGLQVSLSETFNIVSADMASMGVPFVVSDDVSWAPWICKAEPTSIDSIVRTMGIVWNLRHLIRPWGRTNLRISNWFAMNAWMRAVLP